MSGAQEGPEGGAPRPGTPGGPRRLAQRPGGGTPAGPDGGQGGREAGAEGEPDRVLQGTVERVAYADERTLYAVLRLVPEKGYEVPDADLLFPTRRVTAVGRTPAPAEGVRVRLHGRWTRHRTHGLQFEFEHLVPLPPGSEEGLVRYLASDLFEGVGETLAQRIVAKLGSGALERIREDPGVLAGIRGLREPVAERLVATLRSQFEAHRAHALLRALGLGPLQSAAVLTTLGPDCEEEVRRDPYVLARRVAGLGFGTADRVARELGLAEDDPRRLRAGLERALELGSDDGHSLLALPRLFDSALEVLSGAAPREALAAEAEELARAGRIVLADDPARTLAGLAPEAPERLAYLPGLAHSEATLARNLDALLRAGPARPLAAEGDLALAESHTGLRLHPLQRAAALGLLAEPVALLTGGPGVGKTTVLRVVVWLAERAGARVALASPTGRAAKRMAEATGRHARTVHRLLEFTPGETRFARDRERPLEEDLVVVDEISMLDVALAHHLVKAVRPPTRLVLVGDPNQLPSVGPGNVLADLIASGRVPLHRLERVYRQERESLIVENAHRILAGEPPLLPERGDTGSDFYYFPADEPAQCAELLVDVVTRRIPETFGLDWARDVQVLAPMYKGDCGVDALNTRLRAALGIGGREVARGGRTWRVGDRVVHTRNDYEKEVFNGDMGRIADVQPDGHVTVRYPERDVFYQVSELGDLQPAFALTVHRSQGGEFPAVVFPLTTQHHVMLQRHLLYTAVTRARRLLVLVGSWRALRTALGNVDTRRRESRLDARLQLLSAGAQA